MIRKPRYDADYSAKLMKNLRTSIPPHTDFSFATIRSDSPSIIIGHDIDKYFYAASIYKLFIAAETLRQIENSMLSLQQELYVNPINLVGDPHGIFPKKDVDGIEPDKAYTIDKLLEKMLVDSSNTAANVLIDHIKRESINKETIALYGWHGSEVTRKFLARDKEVVAYKTAPSTQSCCRHIAELMLMIHDGTLLSGFVSETMRKYLRLCPADQRVTLNPQDFDEYYHKIGSFEMNRHYKGLIAKMRATLIRQPKQVRWQHDASVVSVNGISIALCFFTKYIPTRAVPYFPLATIGSQIVNFICDNEFS